jgi:hypothetical protein
MRQLRAKSLRPEPEPLARVAELWSWRRYSPERLAQWCSWQEAFQSQARLLLVLQQQRQAPSQHRVLSVCRVQREHREP